MTITGKLLLSTAVGALGGLLFGFDTVVISGTQEQLMHVFQLSPAAWGQTVSIALWGTVAGALGAGSLGARMGGRNALRVMAALYVISALGCALALNWPMLMIFRFIGGVGIGGSSVLGPVYIAELAPAAWRGRLVGTFQTMIVIGILIAYVSNWYIDRLGLGAREWQYQLGIAVFPAIAFLVLLYTVPQSSRFLITQNSLGDALTVLRQMGAINPEGELEDIRRSIHAESVEKNEPLFQSKYRIPIFLAISIGMFNQLSGINAILYYTNSIFTSAGLDRLSGFSQSIYIGLANLVGTVLGMLLIDKLGRKTLLLLGAVGTCISLSCVGLIYSTHSHANLLVWCLVGFIGFFAISQGAVIWVYLSEVFPTRVRNKGQSLGATTHWIMNAIIAALFPIAAVKLSRAVPFYFFAAMMVVQFIVVLAMYPETKGKTLEQLQAQLER
ncbi:sugar porter family MFS transporter [Terriglobus sp.]|uniref:sugar porter family MFS transporter n=1 Tax=Terriglobus sp. TaxID=1889013 RepID=UPI003AFFC599